ncbi:hypothetical protein ACIBJF_23640 [Streptomyces sp. NPDC050743]|uniref:hypothetical protein n=1 Tax=Streptomyces sp. NPDC050743 TaxID=3365634 RepID=UPI0037983A66
MYIVVTAAQTPSGSAERGKSAFSPQSTKPAPDLHRITTGRRKTEEGDHWATVRYGQRAAAPLTSWFTSRAPQNGDTTGRFRRWINLSYPFTERYAQIEQSAVAKGRSRLPEFAIVLITANSAADIVLAEKGQAVQ